MWLNIFDWLFANFVLIRSACKSVRRCRVRNPARTAAGPLGERPPILPTRCHANELQFTLNRSRFSVTSTTEFWTWLKPSCASTKSILPHLQLADDLLLQCLYELVIINYDYINYHDAIAGWVMRGFTFFIGFTFFAQINKNPAKDVSDEMFSQRGDEMKRDEAHDILMDVKTLLS